MNNPLLTIIIPAYNMEGLLPVCLDSIFSSSQARSGSLEVIVVNDGSTDGTLDIARSYGDRITIIDKPNGHYGSCVNAGMASARGLYVKVLDADDSLEAGAIVRFIEELARIVSSKDSAERLPDLIVTNYLIVDGNGATRSRIAFSLPHNRLFSLNEVGRNDMMNLKHHAIAYRAEMLRSMGYRQSEGVPYSDMEWFTLPMSRVEKAWYVDMFLNRYLIGRAGQSMEGTTYVKNFGVVVQLVKRIVKEHAQLVSGCPAGTGEFFLRLTVSEIAHVYQAEMLGIGGEKVVVPLKEFDRFLKNESPDLYQAMEGDYVSRVLKFHPVRDWRKGGPFWPLKLQLFRLYARLVSWMR